MEKKDFQITRLCHKMAQPFIREGDLCVDATMGNGHDTAFLCRSVGPSGQVLAFDIQERALEHTKERLEREDLHNCRLICDSHENLAEYVRPETAGCVMFNLGYLPGGDHALATRPDTTLRALGAALKAVRRGGAILLCIYSGGDSGYAERDALLHWLEELDPRQYLVMLTRYWNRKNDPPIPVLVIRLE